MMTQVIPDADDGSLQDDEPFRETTPGIAWVFAFLWLLFGFTVGFYAGTYLRADMVARDNYPYPKFSEKLVIDVDGRHTEVGCAKSAAPCEVNLNALVREMQMQKTRDEVTAR